MSKKYDEYLENHRNAVRKAYQWISTYIPEFTDAKAVISNKILIGQDTKRGLDFGTSLILFIKFAKNSLS